MAVVPGKLSQVQTQLSAWRTHTEKALAHLFSLSSLVGQMEALKQGKFGVLSSRAHVALLLEVKLIQAMEKALGHIQEEKKCMMGVVQKLKRYSREEQVAFEKAVRTRGLEACCSSSAVEFSHGERCQWLKQIYAAYRADLDNKSKVLLEVRYTEENLHHTCNVWGENPREIQDVLSYLDYSSNTVKLK